MANLFSNLVDNLAEGIHKIKYKKIATAYKSDKGNLIKYKVTCNKYYSNQINEELKKRFEDMLKVFTNDINKFILLLEKMFLLMNIWIKWKSLIKHYCLQSEIL